MENLYNKNSFDCSIIIVKADLEVDKSILRQHGKDQIHFILFKGSSLGS
jgi:hypothetical protein